ncbi:hypothetical protein HanRHA438_Chr17g0839801 [Helianthus annuus]|nr:hypothetical protein HanHA89_Chr17g0728601 [Helianthus annuus]KAJ0828670.1 hypothetical protein HanRHA438_Chr17g0839801 [Helianthus annuus]
MSSENHPQIQFSHDQDETLSSDLNGCLERLDFYMLLLGFNQSSVLRIGITWVTFILIGIVVPVGVVVLMPTNCLTCDLYQVQGFELVVVSSHASLAASALLCLSHNLRKYGIRKFLFVDQYNGYVQRFSREYVHKISVSELPSCLSLFSIYIYSVRFIGEH